MTILSTPFSQRLREATREQHENAENSGFMTALMAGRLDALAYARLAGQLWPVYQALGSAGDQLREDPVVGAFVDPRLDRRAALAADLEVLLGNGWEVEIQPLPETLEYAGRIRAAGSPAYLGHHYTRYLGDLSGGQVLARVLTRTYGFTTGLTFFDFPEIPKPKPYKDSYRARLDALPLTQAEQDLVVQEARVAFDLNSALFAALDGLRRAS